MSSLIFNLINMSLFTTRVELHKASTSEDYKKLHDEMEKEGFWRTIKLLGESASYHLPTAEYSYSNEKNNLDTEGVLNSAKTAAARTGKTFSVFVTKADGPRKWYKLEEVK